MTNQHESTTPNRVKYPVLRFVSQAFEGFPMDFPIPPHDAVLPGKVEDSEAAVLKLHCLHVVTNCRDGLAVEMMEAGDGGKF